nr:hypothetical protein [Micromonospora sp. DSM 115978]
GAYGQQGGYGGYPQGGYQQGGYPPGGGYGGYPPGPPGGPGTPPSNGRRNLVIAGIVAAVLLVVAIPIILLTTSGDDDPDPRPTTALPTAPQTSASSSPSASPTPSQTPSTTPSATPTEDGGEFTVAQQQLQGQLDPNAMQDCQPYPEAEDSDIQAALTCTSEDGRPVVAYSFYDASAAENQASFEAAQVTGDTGDCEFAQADVTEWNYADGEREGDLICAVSGDSFYIYWSYDTELLGFVAGDDLANGAALYEWWAQFEAVNR